MDLFLFVRVLGLGICLLLLLFFFRGVGWWGKKKNPEKTNKQKNNKHARKKGGTMCPSVSLFVSFFARVCCVCVDFRQPQHRLFEKRGVRVCVFFVLTL